MHCVNGRLKLTDTSDMASVWVKVWWQRVTYLFLQWDNSSWVWNWKIQVKIACIWHNSGSASFQEINFCPDKMRIQMLVGFCMRNECM